MALSHEPGSASPEDRRVAEWLAGVQMGQYAAAFAKNGISFAALPLLSEDDLRECGVEALGHRKVILSEIQKLASRTASEPPPTVPKPQPVPPAVAAAPVPGPPKRSLRARILASKFLVVSIAVHLLFGVGATLYVVQRYSANRKLTFKGGAPTTNPSKRAMEHQVSMAKKKNSMSAPAQAKRITTSGLSKIVLPDMPAMPTATTVTANKMGGMGGVGVGVGPAGGMGGGGLGGGGGGSIPFFGFRNNRGGGALTGYLYDIKQTNAHKPTGMDPGKYQGIVKDFVAKNWDEKLLDPYFKSPQPLYTTQMFIPDMEADEAPKAFDVDKGPHKVEPKMWVALYKGKVTAPATGKFRFVGFADDILVVRFNGQNVLDAGCQVIAPVPRGDKYVYKDFIKNDGRQKFYENFGSIRGKTIDVEAGKQYDIAILLGEQPGGYFCAHLLIEQEGAKYAKDQKSDQPKLPIFQLMAGRPGKTNNLPPFAESNLVWKGTAPAIKPASLLDSLKKE